MTPVLHSLKFSFVFGTTRVNQDVSETERVVPNGPTAVAKGFERTDPQSSSDSRDCR